MKAGRLDFGHDELLRRDVRARNVWREHRREAVNPGWGNVGCWIFHGSCMSASWALQGLPRVLEKSVAICANPISFSAFLVSHISE